MSVIPTPDPVPQTTSLGVTIAPAVLTARAAVAATMRADIQPPPPNCPSTAVFTPAPADFSSAIGTAPVWALGFDGPPVALLLNGYVTQRREEHGWARKFLWIVQSDYPSAVTVDGGNLTTHTPLWFGMGRDVSTHPVLLAQKGGSQGNVRDFPGVIYIAQAGCYYLEATWAEGSWRVTFPVGIDTSPAATDG